MKQLLHCCFVGHLGQRCIGLSKENRVVCCLLVIYLLTAAQEGGARKEEACLRAITL